MLKIRNPATGEVIREMEEDKAERVLQKFSDAQIGQKNWATIPLAERVKKIERFGKLLAERKEKLARILTEEMGKPITQSRNEVSGTLARVAYFVDQVEKAIATETVFTDSTQGMVEKIGYEPLGVIANISAWNYPYFVGSNVFVPALLTGNAVLYKPSEFSTLTGLEIARLLHESGIPENVFVPVIGGGYTGSELLNLPVSGVFFTGSYPTGQKIASLASKQLMKIQLELGGKDPIYVCDGVSVDTVAAGVADGAFYNTGQSCCSVERVYVNRKIYDSFIDSFIKTVRGFVVGDPLDEKTYIGPLTREEHLAFLERQVADALEKGANLLCGGKRIRRAGFYFEPTVFVEVNHQMSLMREETFGPLIGIQKVWDDEEAIGLMNDTEYGLTAGVYSQNQERAEGILSKLNAGSVYWNCCDRVSPRLPWSGRGHSGIGSTLSRLGILAFLQPKAWHLRSDQ